MAVTQTDIARAVGVSQTIVSDVLHGRERGRVKPDTRERILQAARDLGYRPNALAQALRFGASRQIAYLTGPDETGSFPMLRDQDISGAVRVLRGRDYRLLIELGSSHAAIATHLDELMGAGVCDGGILRIYRGDEPLWDSLRAINRPLVVVGQCPDPAITSVAHDVPALMHSSIERLVALGHKQIGLLGVYGADTYADLLIANWTAIGSAHGFDPERFHEAPYTRAAGESVVARWLSEPNPPTAILSLGTGAAIGATRAAENAGLSIGNGFDLCVLSSRESVWMFEAGVAVYVIDTEAVGARAAEELLGKLNGQPNNGPIRLVPELVIATGTD
ncbi:MAG TPA: LacI family DNA-binding transcriptional regulator [Capsulimonadaceae bacterium]|jgi:LacI family transcriptional regulator